MKLKILWITPWFPSHPEDQNGSYIWDPIQALSSLGIEVSVLVTQPWCPKWLTRIHSRFYRKRVDFSWVAPSALKLRRKQYLSIPSHYLRSVSNYVYRYAISKAIRYMYKNNQYHLIHAHTEIAGIAAVHVGKLLNIPVLISIHGLDSCSRMWTGRAGKMVDYALSSANKIVFVGDELFNYFYARLGKKDNFRVVYNGFRFSSTLIDERKKRFSSKSIKFISVSNLFVEKGIDIFIVALSKLKEKGFCNWFYTIVGDGVERKRLEKLVVTLGLNEKICFVGACPHNQVYEHLLKADVFCLPSYKEAFGIAYLEAMACGLLTIGVVGQGPEAYIKNGDTGFLVFPKNIDHLVQVLENVFLDRVKNLKIAECGRTFVFEKFTWHHHAKKMIEIYKEVLLC